MIRPDEALRLVVDAVASNPPCTAPLEETCRLQLAEPIRADRDYPPFARAMMDGYAVRVADAGKRVDVVGEVAAGDDVRTAVESGKCLEVMTGAPCPPGTEAVVPKEHVRREDDQVVLPERIASGQHVAPEGSECRAGQPVLEPGQTITPVAIAVAASFGLASLRVIPRPTMAVITTGAELISLDEAPGPGQIRDSNGPMLVTMARDMGLEPPAHLHAEDRLEAIEEALAKVAGRQIVLLTGGVSVGTYDLVPQALERYGARVVFHKVSQKPGKPLLFGRKGTQLIFGLPGNPLSCHFCFHRYVAAAIRCTEGRDPIADPVLGELARPVQPKKTRTYFVAALARRGAGADPNWKVHPWRGTSSADVFASAGANCYAEVPPGEAALSEGETVRFTWIGGAPWPT